MTITKGNLLPFILSTDPFLFEHSIVNNTECYHHDSCGRNPRMQFTYETPIFDHCVSICSQTQEMIYAGRKFFEEESRAVLTQLAVNTISEVRDEQLLCLIKFS